MTFPDPNRLRLDTSTQLVPQHRRASRRPRQAQERFLKGPIAWTWLATAARLPGRALHVAVWIRLWTGIKKSNRIKLSTSGLARDLGVRRHTAYRGLVALEKAELVSVNRKPGCTPTVTVLDRNKES